VLLEVREPRVDLARELLEVRDVDVNADALDLREQASDRQLDRAVQVLQPAVRDLFR
jgi:hypothetical protein